MKYVVVLSYKNILMLFNPSCSFLCELLDELTNGNSNPLLLFQTKQLCLGIARTVILEHRPVPMVARAMDILVTNYSHSIKTGSYLKGVKSEKTSPSTVPHVSSPSAVAEVTSSRVGVLEKSVKHEFAAGVDSEFFNRSSTLLSSDSEENASSEPPKTNSSDIHFVDGKVDREKSLGAETSSSDVQPTSLHVQPTSLQHCLLGPSNNTLNANVPEQQEAQLTSPAISPDEMYSFVFAPIEEEMVGDPSYLVAIVIEFLHRYAVLLNLEVDSRL